VQKQAPANKEQYGIYDNNPTIALDGDERRDGYLMTNPDAIYSQGDEGWSKTNADSIYDEGGTGNLIQSNNPLFEGDHDAIYAEGGTGMDLTARDVTVSELLANLQLENMALPRETALRRRDNDNALMVNTIYDHDALSPHVANAPRFSTGYLSVAAEDEE
jgi:hypothetical protein